MKSLNIILFSFFFLSFFACNFNEEPIVELHDNQDAEQVLVTVEELRIETMSRMSPNEDMSKYLWQKNDTLGVFPNIGGQVEFPISDDDAGKEYALFTGGGWGLRSGEYSYSAYYPFNFYNRNPKAIPFSFTGQVQNGNDNRDHLRNYLFFASAPVKVMNHSLSLDLKNMSVIQCLTLTMPAAKTWSTVSVYTDTEVFPVKSTINLQDANLTQTPVSYADRVSIDLKNIKTTQANQDIVVWLVFPLTSAESNALNVIVRDSEGYTYTAKVTRGTGEQAYALFRQGTWQRRYAKPVLQDGMNSGISGWEESDEDFGGTLN